MLVLSRLFLLRLVVVLSVLLLSACHFIDQEQSQKEPPFNELTYYDKKVFVYQKDSLFALNSGQMHEHAENRLAPVVAYAKSHPDFVITIRSFGTNAKHSTMSSKQSDFQAEAVAAYFWRSGVSNVLRYAGFSQGRFPVSSNRDASIGRENRRLEIEFTNES